MYFFISCKLKYVVMVWQQGTYHQCPHRESMTKSYCLQTTPSHVLLNNDQSLDCNDTKDYQILPAVAPAFVTAKSLSKISSPLSVRM